MKTSLLSVEQKHQFQQILESLIFIAKTRPDIAYATNRLATRQQCATTKDMAAIFRVVMYLKQTIDLGITLRSSKIHSLQEYVQFVIFADGAYVTHRDSKSHSGFNIHLTDPVDDPAFNLDSGPFIFGSNKQSNVATSSTECEVDPVVDGVKSGLWATNMLKEMGIPIKDPLIIYEDNQSLITMISSPSGNFKRTKHFMARIGFLVDQFTKHLIRFLHVISADQLADLLTKPLGPSQFLYLRNKIMGRASIDTIQKVSLLDQINIPLSNDLILYLIRRSKVMGVVYQVIRS
jgi:hypothetical protein